jgi:hypothetical protein
MGVKSLSKYLNQYKAADEKSKDYAKKLIAMEEQTEYVLEDTQITLAIYVSPGEAPQESPAAENDNTN